MGGFVVDLSNQWRMVVNTQFSVCSLEQLFRASVTDSRAHESRKFVAEGRVQLQQAMARTETRISRFSRFVVTSQAGPLHPACFSSFSSWTLVSLWRQFHKGLLCGDWGGLALVHNMFFIMLGEVEDAAPEWRRR